MSAKIACNRSGWVEFLSVITQSGILSDQGAWWHSLGLSWFSWSDAFAWAWFSCWLPPAPGRVAVIMWSWRAGRTLGNRSMVTINQGGFRNRPVGPSAPVIPGRCFRWSRNRHSTSWTRSLPGTARFCRSSSVSFSYFSLPVCACRPVRKACIVRHVRCALLGTLALKRLFYRFHQPSALPHSGCMGFALTAA